MNGKDRILKAALRLFAEQGYSETRTSEIARQAEISEPMIFKHFQSKKNLLRIIIVESHLRHDDMMLNAVGQAEDELAAIENIVAGAIDFALKNRHHFLIMSRVCAFKRDDPELPCQSLIEKSTSLALNNLESAIESGLANGRFQPVDSRAAAKAFLSMAYGVVRLQLLGIDGRHETKEAILQCIRARLLQPAEVLETCSL
jgi:AcrR family transcriptional regulator